MKKITLLKMNGLSKGLCLLLLAACLTTAKSTAQVFCNNEVVYFTEDFGAGTNTVTNANVINQNYQYNGPLGNGSYRVINYTDQNVGWHKSPDHTPNDLEGRTLVVNAKAGNFYRKGVNFGAGYPAGFYAVSFFVMNVDIPGTCANPLLPQITIKAEYRNANNNWIELQNSPITTAPIPETATPTWVQAGGVFVLPTTGNFQVTRIRFTLSDETVGGCGNDFALDDIKLSSCPEGGPVPVKFLSVAAQKNGTGVNVLWGTASESNNDYFDIEKSNDAGVSWVSIGRRQSAGNSSTTRNYAVYDAKPSAGANYYRIKQVDKDGTSKYSTTVVYKLAIEQTEVAVLANPFIANITVDFLSNRSQNVSSRLFDNTGRQVNTQKITVAKGSSRAQIETGNLSRGMYILQVIDEDGQILYSTKLIKQ
ncbi:hypothetical protein BH11BAC4_BH11BAC4_05960 [soil metagenome]